MRRFLIFLSSIIALLGSNAMAQEADSAIELSQLKRYAFQIETKGGYVSGILLVSDSPDVLNGSMVNEFGVSAIDFSYSKPKDKIKLLNVVSFLNKWYIKRVLSNDIKFCLHELFDTPYTKIHSYIVEQDGESISILNNKRHIKYTFFPLKKTAETYETE